MQILTVCKDVLASAALSDGEFAIMAGKRVPLLCIRLFIKSSLTLVVTFEFYIAVESLRNGHGYGSILSPMHFGFSLGSALLIYLDLTTKRKVITALMTYLHDIIDERTDRFFLFNFGCHEHLCFNTIFHS